MSNKRVFLIGLQTDDGKGGAITVALDTNIDSWMLASSIHPSRVSEAQSRWAHAHNLNPEQVCAIAVSYLGIFDEYTLAPDVLVLV